jgi:DeoR family transcriptional regulator of aga operon
VVADRSKIGRAAFARICSLEDVHELITDSGADPEEAAALREHGLNITFV